MDYYGLLKKHNELVRNQDSFLKIILDPLGIEEWGNNTREKLIIKGLPEEWADIGIEYQDPYIMILRDLVKFPSGRLGSYFRLINSADLKGGQATAILPVLENKIL